MKKLFILGFATVAASTLSADVYQGGYSTYNQPSYHSGNYNQPSYQQGNYYQPGYQGSYYQPGYQQGYEGNYYQPGYQSSYYQPTDQGYYPQQGCATGQYSQGAYQGNQTGYGHDGYNYMEDMNHPKFRNEEDRAMYKSVIDSVRSRYPNVSVFVDNGNVTLQGYVRSQDEKRSLEDKIKNMNGVRNLNSQLRVEGEQGGVMRPTDRNRGGTWGTSPQPNYNEGSSSNYNDNQGRYQGNNSQNENNGSRSESDISKKIRSELSNYDNINASVNNGVVTLTGSVDSQNDLEKVERKVRSIRGVRNVNNQLTVRNTSRNY